MAAAVTVATVVRLGLHGRREELEIMELVGAPMAFIRGPFVAEGFLQGGVGALLAHCRAVGGVPSLRGLVGAGPRRPPRWEAPLKFLPLRLCSYLVAGGWWSAASGGLVAAREPV